MTDEREIWLVTRVADLPTPYTPAIRGRCSVCLEEVWIGYAVRADVPNGIPMCQQCAARTIKPEDAIFVTPSVRREAAAWARRQARDRRN